MISSPQDRPQNGDSPLVSVVIPTYNRAYCISRAIDSALAQTHHNLEIVIVDDGSRDNTQEVIQQQYGHEPRVKYFYQDNTGVSGARNHGMTLAQGNFVALLDSDDIWFPWKIEAQLAVFRAFPEVGMVWTDMEAIDPDNQVVNPRYLRTMYSAYRWFSSADLFPQSVRLSDHAANLPEAISDVSAYRGDIYSQMIMGNLVHTSTVLMRRERMQRVGDFNSKYTHGGEDYHFHLRTCREGSVAFLDASSIQYQLGFADQITRPESQINFATSFLETVQTELASHRDRIHLPTPMIRSVLAEAHCWLGEVLLKRGDRAAARQHFRMSLSQRPLYWPVWRELLVTSLPKWLASPLRRIYRSIGSVKKRVCRTGTLAHRKSSDGQECPSYENSTPLNTQPLSAKTGKPVHA